MSFGMKIDLYNYDSKLKGNINRLMSEKSISDDNKQAVQKFIAELSVQSISKGRIAKIVSCMNKILQLAGTGFDLLSANKDQLKDVVRKVEEGKIRDGRNCSEAYKSDMRCIIKQFYKVVQPDESGDCPSKARWIKTLRDRTQSKVPEPLTKEDIDKLLNNAQNDRTRCMIQILWESGIRVGELLGMRIKDVEFVENGVKISVDGKTGFRKILLIESERYIKTWLSNHPYRNERNAPLWVKVKQRSSKGAEANRIGYGSFRVLLQKIAIRAGVRTYMKNGYTQSEIHPHIFRHSAASRLATKMTEATMKKYFGWTMSSDMPATYIHLNGDAIDNEIMRVNGIIPKEEKEEITECPRCYRQNKNADFCSRCAMPLSFDAARKQEELRENTHKFAETLMECGMTEKEFLNQIKT